MRTITEFAAITIRNAAKTKADLVAAGKTPEELPAALGEALKLEGDKLNYLINALEAAGDRTHDLKRVIVSALNEGENAPSGAKKLGEHVYTVEYYAPTFRPGQATESREERGGRRGDKKGGKRGDRRGGRGGERGEGRGPGGDRGPRGPRPEGAGGPQAGGRPVPKPTPKA